MDSGVIILGAFEPPVFQPAGESKVCEVVQINLGARFGGSACRVLVHERVGDMDGDDGREASFGALRRTVM